MAYSIEAELCALRRLSGALLHLDDRGCILAANPAALDLLRRDETEVLGREAKLLLRGTEQFLPPGSYFRGSPDGLLLDMACHIILPGGDSLPVHCCLAALENPSPDPGADPAPDAGNAADDDAVETRAGTAPGGRAVAAGMADTAHYLLRLSNRNTGAGESIFADTGTHLHSYLDKVLTLSGELSIEGRFLSLESRLLVKAGFDESFFLGKDWREFPWFAARPEAKLRVEELFRTAVREKVRVRAEEEVESMQGDAIRVVITLTPLLDESGLVQRVALLASDVTEYRREAKRLDMFAAAIAQTLDGIAIVDMDGFVLYANESWARMHGQERKPLIGLHMSCFHTRKQYDEEVQPFNHKLLITGAGEGEIGHVDSEGRIIPTWMSSNVILGENERPIGLVGVARDMSEMKQKTEELMEARDRAEAALRAKSVFLANMSHEIRTPLNGIIGMTELTLESDLGPEHSDNLRMVQSSAKHLLTVINNILDFSKIEAGRMQLEAIRFNLPDTLGYTLDDLALRAERKGLDLVLYIDPEAPEELIGDPHRLRQVLGNLIGNAIKFTDRGEIILRVEPAGCRGNSRLLHFSISDTGIGIPPERQASIFDSFTQADGSTTRQFGGTGLGTTISKQLVELMGGRIWLESPNNDSALQPGTTFHFSLFFELPNTGTAQPAKASQGRLLLIAPPHTRRELLARFLTEQGLDLLLGASLSEALASRGERGGASIDLMLFDCESAAELPALRAQTLAMLPQQPPSLAILSLGEKLSVQRIEELGLSGQFTRPLRHDALLRTLRFLLEGGGDAHPATESIEERSEQPVTAQDVGEQRDGFQRSPRSARPLRILLAEDNRINQFLAVKLLQRIGHEITVVENGRQALDALEEKHWDILLLDIQMPVMDGYEVTRRIRERERETGEHLSILAMTAAAFEEDRERCLAVGMDGYLRKPFDVQELYRQINLLT